MLYTENALIVSAGIIPAFFMGKTDDSKYDNK